MKIKNLLLICFSVFFATCSNNTVFQQFDRLDDSNQWAQSETKTYEFTIDDDTVLYDVIFQFSHVYAYQFASVPIHFSVEKPDGSKEDFSTDIFIKDDSGKELGDCVGDICDLNTVVKEKMKWQKGHYKITVSHHFEGPYLPNVIGVGLEIAKAR